MFNFADMKSPLSFARLMSMVAFVISLVFGYLHWGGVANDDFFNLFAQPQQIKRLFGLILVAFGLLQGLFYLLSMPYKTRHDTNPRLYESLQGFMASLNTTATLLIWNLSEALKLSFSTLYRALFGLCLLIMLFFGIYFICLSVRSLLFKTSL